MNDDLISRQAAIKIASGYCHPANIAKEIAKLPSAERRGKWIWLEEDRQYECSACKTRFDYDKTYELFDHGLQLASYCPNCGAEMKEEE